VNVLYLLDEPGATLRNIREFLSPHGELRLSNPDERTDLDALFRQLKRDLADARQLDELADDMAVLETFNRHSLSSALHRLSAAEISELCRPRFPRIGRPHDHYAGQSLVRDGLSPR
jgi:hypothetical protein